jgi:dTDP-4-dehydrorhamnose 3,5-epimerase
MINGVVIKELKTHDDRRGFFREIIRVTDDFFCEGFGQLSHSLVYCNVIKAWHAHRKQTQWTYVACGLIKVALYDGRTQSSTYRTTMEFLVGDNQPVRVYSFPPGVLHGYRCIEGPAHVIYVTSGVYELSDEVRVTYEAQKVDLSWLKGD